MTTVKKFKPLGEMVQRSAVGGGTYVHVDDYKAMEAELKALLMEARGSVDCQAGMQNPNTDAGRQHSEELKALLARIDSALESNGFGWTTEFPTVPGEYAVEEFYPKGNRSDVYSVEYSADKTRLIYGGIRFVEDAPVGTRWYRLPPKHDGGN